MAATLSPARERVSLRTGVSWCEYRAISTGIPPAAPVRLTYDRGTLQTMTRSTAHESPSSALSQLVNAATEVLDLASWETGSTTFDREDLQRGFEPDKSFYFRNLESLASSEEIDLSIDPPPDLVIEVDISRDSIDKFPLFAAFGIPEVWRFDGARVIFYVLEGSVYRPVPVSCWLAPLTSEAATEFVRNRRSQTRTRVWLQSIRDWFAAQRT